MSRGARRRARAGVAVVRGGSSAERGTNVMSVWPQDGSLSRGSVVFTLSASNRHMCRTLE